MSDVGACGNAVCNIHKVFLGACFFKGSALFKLLRNRDYVNRHVKIEQVGYTFEIFFVSRVVKIVRTYKLHNCTDTVAVKKHGADNGLFRRLVVRRYVNCAFHIFSP